MSLLQIVVLALIQGITEFLPISSEGHLTLVPFFTNWPDQGLLTDMVTNVGTLLAVIVYFWRDVMSMLRGFFDLVRRQQTRDSRLMFNIIIGTIPIIGVGLVLKLTGLDSHIRSAELVAWNAIVFGIILYLADHYGLTTRKVSDMTWQTSLIIGFSQCLALSPGTSRSGITMTAGRALGFVRSEAARFSFLLSIPANAAASILIIGHAVKSGEHIGVDVILTGVLTFFVGLGTITLLMRIVRTVSFLPFAVYRVLLGAVILGLIYSA